MEQINIENFTYYYGEQEIAALNEINLKVEEGDIILLCGESGSGKSSLGRVVTGAIPYFYGGKIKGSISFNGKGLNELSHLERATMVSMVFQDPERQLVMNKVHREIAFGLENLGIDEAEIKRRVWETLEFTSLRHLAYRDINNLSGGEKQRVAIASALAIKPKCIVLDEPISQLDPLVAEEIVTLVKKINEELGITVIIIEQRLDKWFEMSDRIVVMKDGSVEFDGTKEELYSNKSSYIPNYLKICRALEVESMPKDFRESRKIVKSNFIVEYKQNLPKVNINEVLKIKNLSLKYEDKLALGDVNFSVNKGEFLCVMGHNGGGKSSLFKSIMRLVNYKGKILIDGKNPSSIKEVAKEIAYVSQNPNDYISKDSVYEEIKFTLDNFNEFSEDKIDWILKELSIEHLKYKNPKDTSGGERQRIALASMLVLKPKILLLDEPTRGLDSKRKNALGRLLTSLREGGTTILMITHDMDFAGEYCDRFLMLFSGEIVADGVKEEVLKDGIYYTTTVHKLFRDMGNLYSFNDVMELVRRRE